MNHSLPFEDGKLTLTALSLAVLAGHLIQFVHLLHSENYKVDNLSDPLLAISPFFQLQSKQLKADRESVFRNTDEA